MARATLRSQRVPESIVIEIKGNPEFISETELFQVSQDVVERIAQRFESGHAPDRP